MDLSSLPPPLRQKIETWLPVAREYAAEIQTRMGPGAKKTVEMAQKFWQQLAEAGTKDTVGGTFRHLCVVGLNRSEMLLQGEGQSVFSDNWQDLADDSLKRNLALIFFAPRGLDGQPVNPYLFLLGENPKDTSGEEETAPDPTALTLAEQNVGAAPLLDFCRISPAQPNTVNILIAADILFHWDIKDNYVLPTSPTSWVRDVEQVLKSYPRTTKANIYTQWETDIFTPSDRIKFHKLRDLPLDPSTWLNQPTVQEKYGSYVLTFALAFAALVYAGIWYQENQLENLIDELRVVEQQIPRGGQFSDIERAIGEQEKMFDRRDMFVLAVRDAARALQRSGLKVDNFELRTPDAGEVPSQYVLTVEARKDAYEGWLQQEPAARALLLNSALLEAVRKPPTTTGFKLEGLISVPALQKSYRQAAPLVNKRAVPKAPSPTVPQQADETGGQNE